MINVYQVCGILMEMTDGSLIIGIGCNVLSAPSAAVAAQAGGRPPTSLAQHNTQIQSFLADNPDHTSQSALVVDQESISLTGEIEREKMPLKITETVMYEGDFYKQLAREICENVQRWVLSGEDSAEAVRDDFQRNMDFSLQKLRDDKATQVMPLHLNADGTLQVRKVIKLFLFRLIFNAYALMIPSFVWHI